MLAQWWKLVIPNRATHCEIYRLEALFSQIVMDGLVNCTVPSLLVGVLSNL